MGFCMSESIDDVLDLESGCCSGCEFKVLDECFVDVLELVIYLLFVDFVLIILKVIMIWKFDFGFIVWEFLLYW